jgi:hypothetical protein
MTYRLKGSSQQLQTQPNIVFSSFAIHSHELSYVFLADVSWRMVDHIDYTDEDGVSRGLLWCDAAACHEEEIVYHTWSIQIDDHHHVKECVVSADHFL